MRDNGKMEEDDPTWGLCMMLTDYNHAARDNVDKAMETCCVCRSSTLGPMQICQTCTPMNFTAA